MPIIATLATGAAATLSAYAIVTTDQTALRAAPHAAAAQHAVLWQGDVLEVRGQRMDHLLVYDHRRERAGHVLASQVRTTSALPAEAPELLAVLRFVRDTPGAEALGIGYAAAYLKAVPANAMTAEPFDALGTLADRLARRASSRQGAAAGFFGLRVEVALLQAEGIQPQHAGEQRVVLVPLGQRARRPQAKAVRVATVEVPQLRPLQRQCVARVVDQQRVPDPARLVPAALEHQLHRVVVRTLAWRGVGHERPGVTQVRVSLGHEAGLGQAQQEAGLHDVRQRPAAVGAHGLVQIGQRRVVEGHHPPKRAFRRCTRSRRTAAAGVAARVGCGHGLQCSAAWACNRDSRCRASRVTGGKKKRRPRAPSLRALRRTLRPGACALRRRRPAAPAPPGPASRARARRG